MRHVLCLSAVLLAGLVCCFGYAAGSEGTPPAGKLLHVKVRAVDTLGKPIAGGRIEAWQSGGEGRSWWTATRISVNHGREVRTGDDGWVAISLSLVVEFDAGPLAGTLRRTFPVQVRQE